MWSSEVIPRQHGPSGMFLHDQPRVWPGAVDTWQPGTRVLQAGHVQLHGPLHGGHPLVPRGGVHGEPHVGGQPHEQSRQSGRHGEVSPVLRTTLLLPQSGRPRSQFTQESLS